MSDIFETLPIVSSRVMTPDGPGLVVGYVARGLGVENMHAIVNLDQKPLPVFDTGQNPVNLFTYNHSDLEVLDAGK
ncbi:MAG: hypothetical protein CL609_23670 [Anaerolineaceae bacterium]|nr:hypothetical protein [Anaerolineaceae bacterium]